MPSPFVAVAVVGLIIAGSTQEPDTSSAPPSSAKAPEPVEAIASAPNFVPSASTAMASDAASDRRDSRVESRSLSAPNQLAVCIVANIRRSLPQLTVRPASGDTPNEVGYLVLSEQSTQPSTVGVVRIVRNGNESHLTTWLRDKRLASDPEDIAQRLLVGC
jgi:hypothetical protein